MIRIADYIANFIYNQRVQDVFMLSGGGSIYLDDGVACHEKLNAIVARHEGAAAMMAEAYARLSGNLGVVYVTTGPGGVNALSGVVEAYVDSAPVLVVSGQVAKNLTTHNFRYGLLKNFRTFGTQEFDIVKLVQSVTKYVAMVNNPGSIRYELEKAVHIAKAGRPGPVWLDIPLDVQSAEVDESRLQGYDSWDRFDREYLHKHLAMNRQVDESIYFLAEPPAIESILRLLKKAKRPLIVAGQGIRIAGAIETFKKLLDKLNMPVIFSRLGQDILPYSHPNNFGHGGTKGSKITQKIMKESDLILSLGSRLAVPFVGDKFNAFSEDAKIIMVDIDGAELSKPGLEIDLKINADVGKVMVRILKQLERRENVGLFYYGRWLEACTEYKISYDIFRFGGIHITPINLYYFMHRLDVLSDKGDIFVSDAGSAYFVSGQTLRFEKGQREITSGAFASMGLSIPLAIGCSAYDKDARILAVTGDGSLELNIQELKTMSVYKMNIKLFVINNGGYASIRNTQDRLFGGRYIASDQGAKNEMLNLQKIADAFDLPYFRIAKWEEVDDRISEILTQDGPVFVEVMCDNNQKILEF